jgi:hypothetical protein
MSDFIQWAVKRRRKEEKDEEGFLDSLYALDRLYKADPHNTVSRLRNKVRDWLLEDGVISGDDDEVSPSELIDTFMNRVCQIAGHAWVEFVEGASDDSIRGAAESQRDMINAHLAEFNPNFDTNLMLDVFESTEGGDIPWSRVTDAHLLKLFEPLLSASATNRTSPASSSRNPAGAVRGLPRLLSPSKLKKEPPAWFEDRREPYITPVWEVKAPGAAVASVSATASRYSYTPEHYADGGNCVTWSCAVLDALVSGNWLEDVRTQHAGGGHPLAPGDCGDYDVRVCGRMRCAEEYASHADAQSRGGLRRYA